MLQKYLLFFLCLVCINCSEKGSENEYTANNKWITDNIENAAVTINPYTKNPSKGFLMAYRVPQQGVHTILLARSDAFNNNDSSFNLAFTNLDVPDIPVWKVKKHQTYYQDIFELKHYKPYSISAIHLGGAGQRHPSIHPEFTSLHTLYDNVVRTNKQVQKDLVKALNIKEENLDKAKQAILDLIEETSKKR
jgi:hypothetical protein